MNPTGDWWTRRQRRYGDARWFSRPVAGQIDVGLGKRDVAVVIPARNEEARIETCLKALARQGPGSLARSLIVIVANNCSDATIERTIAAARRFDLPLHVLDLVFPSGGSVGIARRIGFRTAVAMLPSLRYVLTTDADGRVAPDWVTVSVRHLAASHAVCGKISVDPCETALLPAHIRPAAALEEIYTRACLEFESLLSPHGSPRHPHHGQAGGASLGFRASAYLACGGFRDLVCGEDREIIRRFKKSGYRVTHADDVRVVVSCRLDGRAPGGMASSITLRIADCDTWADEALLPARMLMHNALIAAEARRAFNFGEPAGPGVRLRPSGLRPEIDALDCAIGRLKASPPGEHIRTLREIVGNDGAEPRPTA